MLCEALGDQLNVSSSAKLLHVGMLSCRLRSRIAFTNLYRIEIRPELLDGGLRCRWQGTCQTW